ncbi:MAG TPA: hypothetical protein VF756_11015 [Thermoanaerobaculia bacterium]
MKHSICRILALAGMALLVVPARGMAEVRRIELDVAGYLCGL